MKKILAFLFLLTFLFNGCKPDKKEIISVDNNQIENTGNVDYSSENISSNNNRSDENVKIPKMIQIYDLPQSTLENLGYDEFSLQAIGFTKEEAHSIVNSGFTNFKSIVLKKGEPFRTNIKRYAIPEPDFENNKNEFE